MRFGIAWAAWNPQVTVALREGAFHSLVENGVLPDDIRMVEVPGSFELIAAAAWLTALDSIDGVIVLGCVVQGETRHFDFICQGVTQGIAHLNLVQPKPVIFGLLTTLDQEQALERAGGKHGNKGSEAAETAIRMVALRQNLDKG